MRSNKILVVGMAALVALAIAAPSATAGKAKKKKGPVVVGTDPEGDWGANAGAEAPVGGPLGQDLVEAAIEAKGKTINFIIKVSELPPNGGIPEATRYTWLLAVNGKQIELDGKWTNYSRGTCDPTGNTCPPPRDPGMQPFLVRGDCATNGAAVACKELGSVTAAFDPGAGTITVPVPAKLIKAKPGSEITSSLQPDSGFSGVSAAPSAFYSLSNLPYDTIPVLETYTVPKKKKK